MSYTLVMETALTQTHKAVPKVARELPEGWNYGYDDPMGPDCPQEHLCMLLLKLSNPRMTRAEIAKRLGISSQSGSEASHQQLVRIGKVLNHPPNNAWLRQTYLDMHRSQSMAFMKINKAHEQVADTVLSLMGSDDERMRLKASETFLRYFGSLSQPAAVDEEEEDPLDEEERGLMLDVTASVKGGSDVASESIPAPVPDPPGGA